MNECEVCGKQLTPSDIRKGCRKCKQCYKIKVVRNCAWCGTPFTVKHKAECCSKKCAIERKNEKEKVRQRIIRHGTSADPYTGPRCCIICGKSFSPDKRHPHAKKCHACVLNGDYRNRGNVNRNRTCVVCGKDFEITVSGSQICCSPDCSAERKRQKSRERYVPKPVKIKPVKIKEPKPMVTHTCEVCGKVFENYQPVQFACSGECKKERDKRIKKEYRKNHPHNHNKRQHERFAEEKLVDKDITIKKLFMRDGGVCYLCGENCNWNDLIRGDGWATAMGKYPTIDHVIPRAKGGEHSWENVRLACYECNTRKRDHYWLEDKQGQIRFAF